MSYQIKSTPFFRRMLTTSKRNGQLQRLKEEYERIKEFNDRTIEMKMRQVRLKRLFREIEEIKESSSQFKRRRMSSDKAKTTEEIRMETFVKAKELGKEYSKLNALVERCASKLDTVSSNGVVVSPSHTEAEINRKARSVKRISYGNEISRSNIQKLAHSPKKPPPKQLPKKDLLMQKEKLKQRLSYGNTCSGRNLVKIAKRDEKHKVATEVPEFVPMRTATSAQTKMELDFAPADELPVKETRLFKTFEELQTSKIQITPSNQLLRSEEDMHKRAKQHWRKLALTVCNRFDTVRRRSCMRAQELDDLLMADEFKLRSISNDTHLPLSQISVKVRLPPSEGNDDVLADEVLVGVERLVEPDVRIPSACLLTPILKSRILEQVPSKDSLDDSNAADISHKVQKYVKLFEPIVREAAQKEVYEYGVHKLRSIFEHQSNE